MRQVHPSLWRTLLLTLALLGLGSATSAAAPLTRPLPTYPPPTYSPPTQSTRPNIILLLTDDLDALLGTTDTMPTLRSLIQTRGVTFENYFTTISLCCPSRSTYLRGQYVHNHRVYSNSAPEGGFEQFQATGDERSTLAVWLKDAGYYTALMGKYLNGYPTDDPAYNPPGWTEWYSPSTEGAGYQGFNYTMNENGQQVEYGSAPNDYMTDVLTRKAVGTIQRASQAGAPVFLYIAPFVPQTPATPAPRHANLVPTAQAPRGPAFNEADVSDKPRPLRVLPLLTQRQIDDIDELYRQRLRSMQAVDDMIAALVAALRQTDELDNTYLFFTSDNGYHMGQHRLKPTKYLAYEEDIHLPLMVAGPNVPAGVTRPHIIGNTDIAPTFAELAGVQPPAFVDGRSFASLLTATPPAVDSWRKAFLVEQYPLSTSLPIGGTAPPDPGDDLVSFYTAIRTTRFKYVEYQNGDSEVYDLQTDPNELRSLHDSAPRALINELAIWLAQLRGCAAERCRQVEDNAPHVSGLYLPAVRRAGE
ncbi:MAG: sulfatase [Anaerolineae bacterium]|nr:sulfatase [Anaerolineae bacterium]